MPTATPPTPKPLIDVRQQVATLWQSQERASHLVDQLLALALVSEARQLLTLEPVCLSELATQTVLRWMPQADQRGVGGDGLEQATALF